MSIIYIVTDPGALERPMTHARIGYQTITRDCTVSASSEAVNCPADAPTRPDTYERWKPTEIPATWAVDAGAAVDVNYIGIAAHTLGTNRASVIIQWSTDGIDAGTYPSVHWTDYGNSFLPANNSPIMVIGDLTTARYWRVVIKSVAGDEPEIGVVYVGKALEMERAIYGGHAPITMSRNTTIRPNKSEGGQFLGRTVIRKGVSTSASFRNLTPAWVRSEFDTFIRAAREYPFFFAWRPEDYPEEVGYVTCDQDISPSNMGMAGFMQVSFSMNGFADED